MNSRLFNRMSRVFLLVLLLLSAVVRPAYAQGAAQLCLVDDMVVDVFDRIVPFIGLAVFFMFIWGGAMWLMSTGDPQKISKAINTMLWAFVGAVILAMAMVIMGTFESILGLPAGSLRVFDIPC